jgi:hypothetical protein
MLATLAQWPTSAVRTGGCTSERPARHVVRRPRFVRPVQRWSGSFQRATHGRLIAKVLRTESPCWVLVLSPYDEVVQERHHVDERR